MACILLWSSAARVLDSQAYRKVDVTRDRNGRILELREILLSFQTGFSLVDAAGVCAGKGSIRRTVILCCVKLSLLSCNLLFCCVELSCGVVPCSVLLCGVVLCVPFGVVLYWVLLCSVVLCGAVKCGVVMCRYMLVVFCRPGYALWSGKLLCFGVWRCAALTSNV